MRLWSLHPRYLDSKGLVAMALGVVEVAAEPDEGGEAEAGFGDACDDVGGLGRLVGVPVVGDGFGDASELDDGEFGGEPALEDVDATANLGKGHGVTSAGKIFMDERDGKDWV